MVTVIDYAAGNLYSIGHALKHLKSDFEFSRDPEVIRKAERIILPGVGSAVTAMKSLASAGLVDVLKESKVPFLGICLGMQLLFEASEEGQVPCLGIIPGWIRRFDDSLPKVPHMGWNTVSFLRTSALSDGVASPAYFYFVHGYHAPIGDFTEATTHYGGEFSSAVRRDNFWGVQFHPEISGSLGLRLLNNFIRQDRQ